MTERICDYLLSTVTAYAVMDEKSQRDFRRTLDSKIKDLRCACTIGDNGPPLTGSILIEKLLSLYVLEQYPVVVSSAYSALLATSMEEDHG